MATSRTGTRTWKRLAAQAKRAGLAAGIVRCPLCGAWLDYEQGRRPNSAEVDHIMPYSLGGSDDINNVRIICRKCNQSRGNGLHGPKRQRSVELNQPKRSNVF